MLRDEAFSDEAEDWEAEWAAEAHRRAEEIRSGAVKTIPWEEVRAELRRNAGLMN